MLLDYSITTPKERNQYINNLLKKYNPKKQELSEISDYLLFTRDKTQTMKEKKQKYPITTSNREQTINKRQISYEGLIEQLKNGEDGIYSLMAVDKEIKLDNKDPITEEDLKNIPRLAENFQIIKELEKQYNSTNSSKRKKLLKKTIIETWKQCYLIKGSYQIGITFPTDRTQYLSNISIPEEVEWSEDGVPHSNSLLSLLNPQHVSFLLKYYQSLKQDSWDLLEGDMLWHLIDLENIASSALEKKYPLLWDVLILKIDGKSNKQIQEQILSDYGEQHSEQYYSSIWRKRIPKLISKEAQKKYILKRYLLNYKTNPDQFSWKICSKCGQVKPAHSFFFPKNSNKEGFYSQCRECKNRKDK